MVIIKELSDPKIWEDFLLAQEQTPFFQSWWWGEIQKNVGVGQLRLGLYKKGDLVGIAQVSIVSARRGKFFHLRHGPILSQWNWSAVQTLIKDLKRRAKRESVHFLRIAPLILDSKDNHDHFGALHFRNSPMHNMDAENAWILDLDKTEDDILRNMRKTTRYLIRKAQSLGVTIRQTTSTNDLNQFLELYGQTAQRQGFVPHKGIKEEIDMLSKKNAARLFLGIYQNKLIAGAVIIFYGNEGVYHHSGMRMDMGNVPASYLLQWEAIKEAKRRGLKRYNFWGIAPEGKPNHPWQGLTLFKKGFGGYPLNHLHAQDLPFSEKYWLTWLVETARRMKRGY